MSKTVTIDLNDVEVMALNSVMLDIDQWAQNALHERARIAIHDIVTRYVSEGLQKGWDIPQTQKEMILAAYEKGMVKTAQESNQSYSESTK